MKLFSQHGYGDGQKTAEGLKRGSLDGVIFSPRDITLEKLRNSIGEIRRSHPKAEVLFDPQFFACFAGVDPTARLGNLLEDYSAYFQPRRRSQLLSEKMVKEDLKKTFDFQRKLDVTTIIAPNIIIPRSFDSTESAIAMDFIQNTRACCSDKKIKRPVFATLAVSRDALIDKEELSRFLNDLTGLEDRPDGFYVLIAVNSSEAKAETYHADVIGGWMLINHALNLNGYQVINGYSDILTSFLGAAGGYAGATGWWSNLRNFSLDRFVPTASGGRQPVERYLSVRLLNRITYYELDALRTIEPKALNGLKTDDFYKTGSPPSRSEEVGQSWEAIKELNRQLVRSDTVQSLQECLKAIEEARNLYINASTRVAFDPKSDDSHLDPLSEGIQLFGKQAELDLG